MLVLMFIFRATVSAVSCLVVPAFICIHLLCSFYSKLNDDDDDDVTKQKKQRMSGKAVDTCYRAAYTSQTPDQQQ